MVYVMHLLLSSKRRVSINHPFGREDESRGGLDIVAER
jgi:hypothetical protein